MVTEEDLIHILEVFDRVIKIFASLESFAGEINLSKLELILIDLICRERELTMSKLAKSLNIGLSTATGIVDRLINKKLVNRKRNHGDRRVVRVVLTETGKKTALAYQKQKKETIEKMMNMLSVKEQENFILIWDKIANNWMDGD